MNSQKPVKKTNRITVKDIGKGVKRAVYPKKLLNEIKRSNNYYEMVKNNLKKSRSQMERFRPTGDRTRPSGSGAPRPRPSSSHRPHRRPPVIINKNYYDGGYGGGYYGGPSRGWGYDYPVYVPVEVPVAVETPVAIETPKIDDNSYNQSKMLRKQEKMLARSNNLMTFVLLALVGGGLIYLFGQRK